MLRGLLASPPPFLADALVELLSLARADNPSRYDQEWLPYLSEVNLPTFHTTSLSGLEALARLLPAGGRITFGNAPRSGYNRIDVSVSWFEQLIRSKAASRLTHLDMRCFSIRGANRTTYTQTRHIETLARANNLTKLDDFTLISSRPRGFDQLRGAKFIHQLERLSLRANFNRSSWEAFLASGDCQLRELALHENIYGAMSALEGTCPTLAALEHLVLGGRKNIAEGLSSLTRSEVCGRLRSLRVEGRAVPTSKAKAFLQGADLSRLEALHLGLENEKTGLEAADLVDLFELPLITSLSLHGNAIDGDAMEALATLEVLDRLESFSLSGVRRKRCRAGLDALFCSGKFQRLRTLELERAMIDDRTLASVISSGGLDDIEDLSLTDNMLTDEGAIALATSPEPLALRSLALSGNKIGVEGLAALLNSTQLPKLRSLTLHSNDLSRALEESKHQRDRFADTPLIETLDELALSPHHTLRRDVIKNTSVGERLLGWWTRERGRTARIEAPHIAPYHHESVDSEKLWSPVPPPSTSETKAQDTADEEDSEPSDWVDGMQADYLKWSEAFKKS